MGKFMYICSHLSTDTLSVVHAKLFSPLLMSIHPARVEEVGGVALGGSATTLLLDPLTTTPLDLFPHLVSQLTSILDH